MATAVDSLSCKVAIAIVKPLRPARLRRAFERLPYLIAFFPFVVNWRERVDGTRQQVRLHKPRQPKELEPRRMSKQKGLLREMDSRPVRNVAKK